MTDFERRMEALMAMTSALAAAGWRSLDTAPRDGTEVDLRLVHALAPYCPDPVAAGYIDTARAHWIDHNGGGWTWHGLCGRPAHWRPAPDPLPASPFQGEGSGGWPAEPGRAG